MKNRFALTLLAGLTLCGAALADIQSPPGHHYNWSRKLSRGVGNLLYGWTEPFTVWQRVNRAEGAHAAFSDAIVEGLKRTTVRLGYGIYEVATFPQPTWKRTYRPPYHIKEVTDPWWGYTEFSPQIGFASQMDYTRSQGW